MATKLPKQNQMLIEKNEELKEVLMPKEVLMKLDGDAPAPILPFEPYRTQEEYEAPFSNTLLERSNALAREIWGTKEAYDKAHSPNFIAEVNNEESAKAVQKNREFFEKFTINSILNPIVAIENRSFPFNIGSTSSIKLNEIIKKVKRIEKERGIDEIFDFDMREQLRERVLFPATSFGVYDQFGAWNGVDLRYPPSKAVSNGVLTSDEVLLIENTINYIPKLRTLLTGFRNYSEGVDQSRLLEPFTSRTNVHSEKQRKQLLQDLKNLHNFFFAAVNRSIIEDFIPSLRYPSKSDKDFEEMQRASTELRNAAVAFASDEGKLSVLLEKIAEVESGVISYFFSLVAEIDAFLSYLGRLSISFEQFVEESKGRIDESLIPF